MIRPALWVALGLGIASTACGASLAERARRAAEAGTDPEPIVESLRATFESIDETKRIFSVSLVEGGRRFSGEGALTYRARPRTLSADVFGPHDAHVLQVRMVGDSLTVVLPQEGEVLTGEIGDPRFAELTGERALVSPEILGAILGAYDIDRLLEGSDRVSASVDGGRRTLYVTAGGTIHALTLEGPRGSLVEYLQARGDRLVYRVRFGDFQTVDGRLSPWRVVLRDFVGERDVVVEVRVERSEIDETGKTTER